jgi:fengycin family lipopeptide synthetase B
VLQVGGIYVPLAPDDPPQRIEELLHNLNITVILTRACAPVEGLPGQVRTICVDSEEVDPQPEWQSFAATLPDEAAYIIHTSGSTGEARAVLVSHRTLRASTRARQQVYGEPVQRFLLVSPLTFDSSIAGLFWTLVDGGTLILPQEVPANAEEVRQLIAQHSATHLLCIPRLLQALVEGAAIDLQSLQVAIVAGEACARDIATAFLDAVPRCEMYNEYGVAEAGVWSTVHRVDGNDAELVVPIGSGIPGARVYICDDQLNLAPFGAVGEICIGGDILARGYAGRPDVTAERFLPDPHAGVPGARLYRTGDRAHFLEGRTLSFLGRVDNRVKIRGQRLELEQLEAIIRQGLPVAEVAAVVDRRTSSPGLALMYTTTPANEVTPEQVRAVLAARLPKGLSPSIVSIVSALPRTATGKLDRRRLEQAIVDESPRKGSSPPQTPLERTLAAIWAPLLGVTEIGRDADFFALGGDSIVSLQITARARSAGLLVTPQQILVCRTIAALANELEGSPSPLTESAAESSSLTPIQRWFFEQEFATPQQYNQAVVLQFERNVNVEALRLALRAVVSAHVAFQTGFTKGTKGWRARQDPEIRDISLHFVDVPDSGSVGETELIREALSGEQGWFDLSLPPLMRALLVRRETAESGNRLIFVAHHLIIDGVSWRIFLDDLVQAYESACRGEQPVVDREFATPGQWMHLMARRAQEPAVRALADYWQRDPGDALNIPLDYAGSDNRESGAAELTFELASEYGRILKQSDGDRAMDAALLASWLRAVAEWREQDGIWITVESHGREMSTRDVDVSRTMGWFTAAAPLYLKHNRCLGPEELAADVGAQLARMPRVSWLFDYLRYCEAGIDSTSLANLPEPQISFNNLGAVRTTALPSSHFTIVQEPRLPLRSPNAHRPYLIDLTVSSLDNAVTITITYNKRLHANRTIQHLGERTLAGLKELCAAKASAYAL